MGKSKTASFSSVEKSNFQLFKEKFKEKSANEKLKNDENENEKKKKKKFWSKWLTSVRGSWSCAEARTRNEISAKMAATKSLEAAVDLYGTTIDPDRHISRIVIEPTNTAGIPQNRNPLTCPDQSHSNKRSVRKNDYYEIDSAKEDVTSISQEPLTTRNKSTSKTAKQTNETGPPQKIESLLTSALFIHKDIDRMVESAVFMEPNLPRDYTESKISDDISQKSLSINNVRVSYKGNGNDHEIIKTFKTNSEPTWEERKKIIHQQRLKENINYLVKQFVFLDAQDVMDFSRSSSSKKHGSQFSHSLGCTSRELSREVAPEILVNKKPFKEYVSENVMKNQRSFESSATSQRNNWGCKIKPTGIPDSKNNIKVTEKRTCPVLKSTVTFLKKNDSVHEKENSFEVKESTLTISPVKEEVNSIWRQGFSQPVSESLCRETPSFSFWDVYETYSTCKNMLQVEVELENTSFQFKQKKSQEGMHSSAETEDDVLRNSKSLDEVLNALEDGDHDVIFQKNLSQFKKKISVMPRLDFRKNLFNTNKKGLVKMDDRVWRKIVRVEKPFKTEKPITKLANFSLENSREKKIEMYRSELLDLQMELFRKSERIMENVYFLFGETTVVSQILGTRIEVKTFSSCQTLREICNMQENNNVAHIKIENPTEFGEFSRKIELLIKTPTLFKKSYLVNVRDSETIAMILHTGQNSLHKSILSIPNAISEEDVQPSENFQVFLKAGEWSEAQLDCTLMEDSNTKSELLLKETNNDDKGIKEEQKIEVNRMGKSSRTGEKTTRKVVLILNDPSYEYTVRIYDNIFGTPKHHTKSYSEPDIFRNLANDKRFQSDSAVNSSKKETTRPGTPDVGYGNTRLRNYTNSCKKNLEDEMIYRCLLKNQNTRLKAEKEGNESQKSEIGQNRGNSSSKETATQSHSSVAKQRKRRSHLSLKEFEKRDLVHCSNKRVFEDEIEEVMDTESEELTPKQEKSSCENNLESLVLEEEEEEEGKSDKTNTIIVKNNGPNIKKGVVAAINLIKDLNQCKGEGKGRSKQLSLVIMLSRN